MLQYNNILSNSHFFIIKVFTSIFLFRISDVGMSLTWPMLRAPEWSLSCIQLRVLKRETETELIIDCNRWFAAGKNTERNGEENVCRPNCWTNGIFWLDTCMCYIQIIMKTFFVCTYSVFMKTGAHKSSSTVKYFLVLKKCSANGLCWLNTCTRETGLSQWVVWETKDCQRSTKHGSICKMWATKQCIPSMLGTQRNPGQLQHQCRSFQHSPPCRNTFIIHVTTVLYDEYVNICEYFWVLSYINIYAPR